MFNRNLNLKAIFVTGKCTSLELFFYALVPSVIWHSIMSVNGYTLLEFAPYYSDELHYWNEINNFKHAGFNSGYSVINELPARWGASSFGPHGPIFPVLYGMLAYFFGWHSYSPVIFNTVLITLSYYVFLHMADLGRERVYFSVILLSSFLPAFQFVFSGMQESINHVVSIFIALIVLHKYKQHGQITSKYRQYFLEALAFLAFAAIRVSWGLIFGALAFHSKQRTRAEKLVKVGLAISVVGIVVFWQRYSFSPVVSEGQVSLLLESAFQLDSDAFGLFLSNINTNVISFFSPNSGRDTIPFYYRIQLVLLISYLVYLSLRAKPENYALKRVLITLTLILIASAGLVLILYEVGSWRDYRVLTPSILVVLLMLPVLVFQRTLLIVVCIVQVLSTSIFMPTILEFRKYNYLAEGVSAQEIREVMSAQLWYQESDSRWCNTLLLADTVFGDQVHTQVWKVGAGIGVSLYTIFLNSNCP